MPAVLCVHGSIRGRSELLGVRALNQADSSSRRENPSSSAKATSFVASTAALSDVRPAAKK